ncbi:MAG: hypothetical protein IJ019_01505 [Alphaproteobacteria bacterium]|nr:hypothetical protein [Alphaproteobacteria bacterium]
MQDNDFERARQFYKMFENERTFSNFCFSLSKKRIQNMTTDEWISFFYGLNRLGKNLGYKTTDEVVKNHREPLEYMYSNFRLNKNEARKIKTLAYQMADALATSKTFADFYYAADIGAAKMDDSSYQHTVKTMRKFLYDEIFGDGIKHSILAPDIKISSDKRNNTSDWSKSGHFLQDGLFTREVDVHLESSDFCNTAAHELYHSLQRLSDSKRAKLLKKLRFEVDVPFDTKTGELYSLNHAFYLKGLADCSKGYQKQPLEYGARFFATCFERRLRHNLRASQNNWGAAYMSTQLLRHLDIFEGNLQTDKVGVVLSYIELQEKDLSLLQEFSQKYVKNQNRTTFFCAGNVSVLAIEPTKNNIINLNRLYTNMQKARRNKTLKTEFLKQYFPITYQKYYATEQEKLAQKSVLSRVMINRLHKDM